MIEVFFFSIAGKKAVAEVTAQLQDWYSSEYVPKVYKESIKYTLEIVTKGEQYPSSDYYSLYFTDSGLKYSTKAEILNYADLCTDYYKRLFLSEELTSCINQAKTYPELQALVSQSVETSKTVTEDFTEYSPALYTEILQTPYAEGIKTGISAIDSLTNGFQPTTVATLGGYAGEGKSLTALSIIYKNALQGKKCVYLSLEMAPVLIWEMLEARFMYEAKGLQITTTDLIQRKLTKENVEKLAEFEEEFRERVVSNVLVVDTGCLTKECAKSTLFWKRLYQRFDAYLNGLDLVVHDHVGQYDRLYPDLGNIVLKMISDCTVTFRNSQGVGVCTLWCCQANREGWKRALRNNGLYDKSAVADLNAIERESSYLMFVCTPPDKLIVQETIVCMPKHRLGAPLTEPVPVSFIPSVVMVGSTVEQISYTEDFSDMGAEFGDFSVTGEDSNISGLDLSEFE